MDLVFINEKSTEISFKVGIVGTNSAPQAVYVSLSSNDKSISFIANKVGESYTALVSFPDQMLEAGEANFSINVKMHDKIFTPFKSIATIVNSLPVSVPALEEVVKEEVVKEVASASKKLITLEDLGLSKTELIVEKREKKSILKSIELVSENKNPVVSIPTVTKKIESKPVFNIKRVKVIYK